MEIARDNYLFKRICALSLDNHRRMKALNYAIDSKDIFLFNLLFDWRKDINPRLLHRIIDDVENFSLFIAFIDHLQNVEYAVRTVFREIISHGGNNTLFVSYMTNRYPDIIQSMESEITTYRENAEQRIYTTIKRGIKQRKRFKDIHK